MRLAHFCSNSLGDIQKSHEEGIWQFRPKSRSLSGIPVGSLVIISLNGADRFFMVGLASSKVRGVTKYVDWPSRVDVAEPVIIDEYGDEITIAQFKDLREFTKEEIERVAGFELKMNQGCCYTKEMSDISKLLG